MRKQKGLILLTAIMVLSLLSLLIISAMQNILLYYKGLNKMVEKNQDFYQIEFYMQQLTLKHWKHNAQCVVVEQEHNQIISLLANRGCKLSDKNRTYFYLVEELGVFPCLQSVIGKEHYSTEHWRINLLSKKPKAFLQLRIARLTSLAPCQKNKANYIHQGLLSWRYLDDFSFQ
ncbi:hypothetical protein [Legionella brunensis]|uniref:Tfp pilus assembly protein PilX n=1 Tax=Legionella brunensis TaxID=29422 RepID=A0A0W0SDQ7_9GAMM|nr:hypothetical protein [Legionella brunensis]KTC81542.1 hypothetical protein Lbru_2062 [Legionella brunensis]